MKQEKYIHWKTFIKIHDIGAITDLCQDIRHNLLPHGSGINFTWRMNALKNGKLVFYNAWDGMNETGMYCHVTNFKVTFHIEDNNLILESVKCAFGDKERNCCSYGIRDYLAETIGYTIPMDSIL